VVFELQEGAHRGARARGQFPIAGRGLLVLVAVALFEPLKNYATVAARLVGAQLVADVSHGGTNGHSLALVRNLRPVKREMHPAPEEPAVSHAAPMLAL